MVGIQSCYYHCECVRREKSIELLLQLLRTFNFQTSAQLTYLQIPWAPQAVPCTALLGTPRIHCLSISYAYYLIHGSWWYSGHESTRIREQHFCSNPPFQAQSELVCLRSCPTPWNSPSQSIASGRIDWKNLRYNFSRSHKKIDCPPNYKTSSPSSRLGTRKNRYCRDSY